MLGWIVRILFVLAAPITALLVSRDSLNFGLIQTFVAMFLLVGFLGLLQDGPREDHMHAREGARQSWSA